MFLASSFAAHPHTYLWHTLYIGFHPPTRSSIRDYSFFIWFRDEAAYLCMNISRDIYCHSFMFKDARSQEMNNEKTTATMTILSIHFLSRLIYANIFAGDTAKKILNFYVKFRKYFSVYKTIQSDSARSLWFLYDLSCRSGERTFVVLFLLPQFYIADY